MFNDQKDVEIILSALGEHLEQSANDVIELLVCGGSALNVVGLVHRTTKDVDVLAYINRNKKGDVFFIKAEPLSPALIEAAKKVARDFNLPETWLNAGPASAVDFGLPEGLITRVVTRQYRQKLIVHFLGRYDQIHFKLYAVVDQGAGKHLDDLIALTPTADELEKAARWSMTHDVSDGFKQGLREVLTHLGFKDVATRL
jgi:hypothetical protein